jgi:hypothetical protein
MSFTVDMGGIKDLQRYMTSAPDATRQAMSDAINGAIKFAYAESSREIRKDVNFSQDYIGSVANGNRLKVSLYATKDAPIAKIRAEPRAVSLARFAANRGVFGKAGVSIMVKPGREEFLKESFLMRLSVGSAAVTTDNFNIGLAVRLKPGQVLRNRHKAVKFSTRDPNLYLLYGPSVDQVFNHVRDRIEPAVSKFLTSEFYRNFARHV